MLGALFLYLIRNSSLSARLWYPLQQGESSVLHVNLLSDMPFDYVCSHKVLFKWIWGFNISLIILAGNFSVRSKSRGETLEKN